VQNTDNDDPVFIIPKVNAPLAIGKCTQAGAYPVSWRAGKFKAGNFIHLPDEIGYETLRRFGVLLSDMCKNLGEVRLGRF